MLCSHKKQAKQRRKIDQVSKKGFSLRTYKNRTEFNSSPRRHSITIVSIQNISAYLADLHLTNTTQTQCREKRIESRAIVRRIDKRDSTFKRTMLPYKLIYEEQTQVKKNPSLYY